MYENEIGDKPVTLPDTNASRRDILEIKNRLFDIFLVHVETGNTIQRCSHEQLWEIKQGLQEIRRLLMHYAPEDKRARSLTLLNEFLDVLSLATMPFVFGTEKLLYPRMLYSELFEAANQADLPDSPEWIIEHMVGTHIIYNEAGMILNASGSICGYSKDELIGKHFAYFIVSEHLPMATQQYGNLLRGKRGSHSYLVQKKDSTLEWATFHCHPYSRDGKFMVLSAIQPGRSEDYLED